MNKLTLGSLFDGSGGFPLGALLAGIQPVWASEIEPFPIRVTTKRLPFMKHYGDISEMDGGKIEPVDIITFGSPCQDMSVAGKRAGLDGNATLKEADNYIYSRNGRDFSYDLKEYCDNFQSVYNTYSSYHEDKLHNTSWIPADAKKDQMLIYDLIARMGDAAVFHTGSSSVLYRGFIGKLDKSDYSRTAKIEGEKFLIPIEFAKEYFGASITGAAGSYFDIESYCVSSDYSFRYDSARKLAVVTPKNVAKFENDAAKPDGKHTDGEYLDRMYKFFNSDIMPEPNVNTEQTRVVIEYAEYPKYALDFRTQQYITTYSPSIAVVKEGGKSVYYVSYELCLVVNYEELAVNTVIKKSTDGGATWTTVVEKIPDIRWGSVFENKGVIYLLGSDLYTGDGVIIKVGEDGKYQKAILFTSAAVKGTAPGTVLHAYGRIYKAYHIASVSADENSDLMNKSSWTVSSRTNAENLAPTGGEGSMVLGKNGKIYQVMHSNVPDEAFVLELTKDGKTYSPVIPATGNKVYFPTCISKSSVIYDEKTGKYLSLSNICNTQNQRQRNILALLSSDDLITWKVAEYLLVDREMINPLFSTTVHAFQYTDFKIDGEDIVYVVREAAGYANTYHDGNYTTFYRLEGYADLLK